MAVTTVMYLCSARKKITSSAGTSDQPPALADAEELAALRGRDSTFTASSGFARCSAASSRSRRTGFQQIVDRLHLERLQRMLLVGGNEDDARRIVHAQQMPRGFQAIHAGHVDVEEQDVGAVTDRGERVLTVLGLGDDNVRKRWLQLFQQEQRRRRAGASSSAMMIRSGRAGDAAVAAAG